MSRLPDRSEASEQGPVLSHRRRPDAEAYWAGRFGAQRVRCEALGLTDAWFQAHQAETDALRADYLRGIYDR